MRFVATQVIAVGVMCGGIVAAFPNRLHAADEAFAPDRALTAALAKGDKAVVSTLLDAKFQWVDVTGRVRTKAEALENLASFAASDKGMESPTEMITRDYGQLEMLRGIHNDVKFGHIWVKSTPVAPWRAFVYVDTPIRDVPERPFTPRKPTNAESCENPCHTTPFNEDNPATAAVKKTWMRIKVDEWEANAEDWDSLADVDHITISSTGALSKKPHVEELARQHEAFGGAGAGVPVISGTLTAFGNVVVMTDVEGQNGKPAAFALRLFIDRGQGWKICLSIHTEIGAGRAGQEGD